jgi:hypothetical protein
MLGGSTIAFRSIDLVHQKRKSGIEIKGKKKWMTIELTFLYFLSM